jgi:hypothetical protein
MKTITEDIAVLADKIAASEERLQNLAAEIEEIGQPAAHDLKRRFDALVIEEKALKRNLAEALGMDDADPGRLSKIRTLLEHIEREQAAVESEAGFLQQAAPSSVEVLARTGNRLIELCLQAIHRVTGDHHPLGESVFVNHSHRLLAERYGLDGKVAAGPHKE